MKKLFTAMLIMLIMMTAFGVTAYAESGDMGFFGGITEGVRLPKTSEVILARNAKKTNNPDIVSTYKEIIFIAGVPVEFEGQLTIKKNGVISDTTDSGSYRVTYTIVPTAATSGDVSLNRAIAYTVNWYRDKDLGQIHKEYSMYSWAESITVNGETYVLDSALSHWDISILEDVTAAVTYYKGRQSKRAVYLNGEEMATVEANGDLYGYNCAWSHTETHRISENIYHDGWQLSYEVRPSVSAYKTLDWHPNEPLLISFPGNYQEVLKNESGLAYNIYTLPQRFYGTETYGTASIDVINVFENLSYVDTSALTGHWAQEDISRLYSLGILTQRPNMFQPDQLMTRSQFFIMLVKALNLELEPIPTSNSKKKEVDILTFPDVNKSHPAYQYVMAAYKAGIATGKGSSQFCPDDYVTLEEAVYTVVKSLGLLSLGLEPTNMTAFADDADISNWAKKSLYAAWRIRLVSADEKGNINAQQNINKAFGAALINRMIEYMRTELKIDYTEHIVHFTY